MTLKVRKRLNALANLPKKGLLPTSRTTINHTPHGYINRGRPPVTLVTPCHIGPHPCDSVTIAINSAVCAWRLAREGLRVVRA